MTIIESVADPTVTVGLAIGPIAVKVMVGEMVEALRWCDLVIDLAEGDRAMGDFIVGSPLGLAYAIRSTARWWLGQRGWQDDFNRGLAMARDADPVSRAAVIVYTYYNAIGIGVIVPDRCRVA